MLNTVALQHAMLDAQCSRQALAKACGISVSALYRRLTGAVPFTVIEVARCMRFLELSPEKRDEIFFAE